MNTLITKDRLDELVRIARLAPDGPMAEVGVYKGGSLKYLADAFPGRKAIGFDTFEGLPAEHYSDMEFHKPGEFADTHVEAVSRFINRPNVELVKGLFPDSAWAIDEDVQFAVVHIDTDFYLSVKACIEWFYPRLLPGGVIVFDDLDWPNCPGVRKALEESGLPFQPTRVKYQGCIHLRRVVIRNDNHLIGDFIGTIPAMIEMAKGSPVEVICPDATAELLAMIPQKYGIRRAGAVDPDKAFDLHGAFALADGAKKLHMIQANFHFMGLPIPEDIPVPELQITPEDVPEFDYILSPFSRSLPEGEKWQQDKWQALVNAIPGKRFALLGSSRHDDANYLTGVTPIFDQSMNYVANVLQRARDGLISVVTGTSHLAYALRVKNYLFFNQGLWGKNPDAILLDRPIRDISVQEVIQKLST